MNNKIKLLALCIISAHAAPAAPRVLIKVEGRLFENGLFSGQVIQNRPFSLLGADISFSDELQPIQPCSSGTYSGLTGVNIQGSNGQVTCQRNTSLTFSHTSGGDVIGDYLGSSIGLSFYVLGGPGTPFSWSATGGAATSNDNGASTFYQDLGYSNPGLVFNWGPAGGTTSGDSTSRNNTLIFAGRTYSQINITPDLGENVFFGFSGPYNYPPTVSGEVRGGLSMTVRNLGGPAPILAVSRKAHGGAPNGPFDIDLPLVAVNGPVGIECRIGGVQGAHQVVVLFESPVTVGGVSVTAGTANATFSVANSVVTVNLTGAANGQRIGITLTNVSDGTDVGNVTIPMGLLLGDTNGNGQVNGSDLSQTKAQSGVSVGSANFRTDVNSSGGFINSSDISLTKTQSGTFLPQ